MRLLKHLTACAVLAVAPPSVAQEAVFPGDMLVCRGVAAEESAMTAAAPAQLVNIQDLQVTFPQLEGSVLAVRGVSIHLDEGESLGIVGESGSGKSVSCMALLRLLNSPPAKVEARRLEIAGVEVTRVSRAELSRLRGGVAAMIFQDPMTAFDPSYRIGYQIIETIRAHRGTQKKALRRAQSRGAPIHEPVDVVQRQEQE